MAYEYPVSFEIRCDSTYDKRYDSLIDELHKTRDAAIWKETTSLIRPRSTEEIDELVDRLYYESRINAAKDIHLFLAT